MRGEERGVERFVFIFTTNESDELIVSTLSMSRNKDGILWLGNCDLWDTCSVINNDDG